MDDARRTLGDPGGDDRFPALNGGMGYMDEYAEGEELEENIRQWKVIRELQRHVAMEKMVDHKFLNSDRSEQRTVFSDGTRVMVNFKENTYRIDYPEAS